MRSMLTALLAGVLLALAACAPQRPALEAAAPQGMRAGGETLAATPGGRIGNLVGDVPLPVTQRPQAERLGTRWGEDIASRVSTVRLSRLHPDRPDDTATIRYGAGEAGAGSVASGHPLRTAYDGRVDWSVLGTDGRPMPVALGATDVYLKGREGDRYRLEFRNQGRWTVEIVATVDGLDVISGRPGSVTSRGYVVRPGGVLVIDGFRRSEDAVAAFRFSSPGDAYAARTPQGDPRNTGVIGIAVFTLDEPPAPVSDRPQPFPADQPRDPRFAPPPTP